MSLMANYPLLLDLLGKRACVIGGGLVATRRTRALIEAGAKVTVVAPTVTPELQALTVDWQQRVYADGDLAGSWLAHAATDDPQVNAAVAAEAEREHIFCIRADDATRSGAWVPAVLRDGDITVAVNAGRNPGLAIAVRDGIRGVLAQIVAAAPPAVRRVD